MAEKKATEQKEAETKTSSTKAQVQKEALVSDEVREKLTQAEKNFLELQEQKVDGVSPTATYKLKDPNSQYVDTDNNDWTLASDQEKTLPENPSSETLARIKEGFIIKVGE